MPIFKKALLTLTLMLTFLGGMFVSFVPHPETGQMQMSITSASAQGSTSKADTAKTEASAAQNDEIKTIKEAYEKLVELINIVLGVVTILVSPIVLLAGWLMSPDWTSGDLFRLREPMYQLWITISNIVYFLYAILLIIIALATIFNSQNYGYKALLPRLFLGILLVPFTWWAVQWMISIASVVTASVVTIPYETIEALNAKSENKNNIWWENPSIPRDIDSKTLFTSIESIKIDCSKEGSNCIAPKKFTEDAAGMYGSLVIYAYSVFRIQDVKMINTKFDAAKGLVDIVTNGIISAVMFILFGLLTIALVVILFVRAFKLWIYAIFSPLFTFKFVLGKSWGNALEDFDFSEFLGTVFMPALVGVVLSFGLIIVSTLNTALSSSSTQAQGECQSEQWCVLMHLFGNHNNKITQKVKNETDSSWKPTQTTITTITIGGINIHFHGSFASGINGTKNFIGIFGEIIVQCIALVFLWIAFMAAVKTAKFAEKVIAPFAEVGEHFKKAGGTIVKHIPLPAVGNVWGIGAAAQQISTRSEASWRNRAANSFMGRATGMQQSNVTVDTNINTYISGVNVTQNAPGNTIGNRANFDTAVNSIRTEHGNNGQAQADSMRRLLNGVVERFNVNGQFQAQQWREWMTYNFGADNITRL